MKWNALKSSIILGLIWGIWQIPLFFGASMSIYGATEAFYYQDPFWGIFIGDILLTIMITWVYNNTKGSLLPPIIIQTMFILSTVMFPVAETDFGGIYFLLLFSIVIAIIIAAWGHKTLARSIKLNNFIHIKQLTQK